MWNSYYGIHRDPSDIRILSLDGYTLTSHPFIYIYHSGAHYSTLLSDGSGLFVRVLNASRSIWAFCLAIRIELRVYTNSNPAIVNAANGIVNAFGEKRFCDISSSFFLTAGTQTRVLWLFCLQFSELGDFV